MVFELFQKLYLLIYARHDIHDIINYSSLIWPFESGKCEKEGNEKNFCIKYLKNDRTIRKSIKNLTKNELKTELTDRGLRTQGTKEVLLNRLSKAMQEVDTRTTESESRNEAKETERNTSNTS